VADLSRHDRDLIVEIVTEVLAEEPEELVVFTATSEDLLQQAASGDLAVEADSDAFFGGLHLSLGELLVHVLVAVAIDCAKHGFILSREIVRKRLEAWLRDKSPAVAAEIVPALKRVVSHLEAEGADESGSPGDPKRED
jgi:hypothetical protein